jgi:hypothetical protein
VSARFTIQSGGAAMRYFSALIFMLLLSSAAWAQDDFEYAWDIQKGPNGEVNLIGEKPAPVPFSMTGEPAASMTVVSSSIEKNQTLNQIVDEEVAGIKAHLIIAEYMEDDFEPKDDIAVYTETHLNTPVAFIKYRTHGEKDVQTPMPSTVRHAIFMHNGRVYYIHLFVLYAEDQDIVRRDQIKLIERVIQIKATKERQP